LRDLGIGMTEYLQFLNLTAGTSTLTPETLIIVSCLIFVGHYTRDPDMFSEGPHFAAIVHPFLRQ
jgi:hypothetical protein